MVLDRSRFNGCRAVLFDFGGTLDSDGEHWLDRFQALYREEGLFIPPDEIKRAFYCADALCCSDPETDTMGLRPLMKRHIRLQFNGLGLKDDHKEERLVNAFCEKSEIYLNRNRRILQRLKKRYRTGVVSNFYGNVAELCREAGLAGFLDVISDSTALGVGKPDPEIFRISLRELGLAPPRTIFVGDSYERDVIPSREIGMKTIWLKGPNPRVPPNAGPAVGWISSLTELEGLLS